MTRNESRCFSASLLYAVTAALLTWRMWMGRYNQITNGAALRTTVLLELLAVVVFSAALFVRFDFLGGLHRLIRKCRLYKGYAVPAINFALICLGGILRYALGYITASANLITACIVLALGVVYTIAKGPADEEEISRSFWMYPFAMVIILVLSAMLTGSITIGLLLCLVFSISNFHAMSIIDDERITPALLCKAITGVFIPFLVCILLFIASGSIEVALYKLITGKRLSITTDASIKPLLRCFEHSGWIGGVTAGIFLILILLTTLLFLSKRMKRHLSQLDCSAIALCASLAVALVARIVISSALGMEAEYHIIPFMGPCSIVVSALLANRIVWRKER